MAKELWTREEHVLALDVYMRNPSSPPSKTSAALEELSSLLNRYGIQRGATRHAEYRNPTGIYMKMMNFRRLDPRFQAEGKVGLRRGADAEKPVWNEFADRRDDLRAEAQRIRDAIEAGEEMPAAPLPADAKAISSFGNFKRVWITSFWGFDPEHEGYLGFTEEGNRRWFLKEWKPGDIVLIFGTQGTKTPSHQRGRVLGFLEVEGRPIRNIDRLSPEGVLQRRRSFTEDRWTNAVPVTRAWRVAEDVPVRAIASHTLHARAQHQLISARGQLLAPAEALAALDVLVRPTDVFGAINGIRPEYATFVPSAGISPTFGQRVANYEDGEAFLYLLRLGGELLPALLRKQPHELRGKAVVKIGYSKEPAERLQAHRATLPKAAVVNWNLVVQSRPFPCADDAKAAEDRLKDRFAARYTSLGNEFFLCDERSMVSEFTSVAELRPPTRGAGAPAST